MLHRNPAGYKIILHNVQIPIDLMNNYAIMSSDEWSIAAMMKNWNNLPTTNTPQTMKARNGKIARLPCLVRGELNVRRNKQL